MTGLVATSEGAFGLSIAWSLVVAAILIVVNGFFVAFEFAMVAAKRSAFEAGAEQGRRIPKAAIESMSDLSLQLAGAQFGITLVTLALGYVGEPVLAGLFESVFEDSVSSEVNRILSFVLALTIVSFLHLVVGEMVPKNIAIAAAVPTVRWLVLPSRAYLKVFGPVVRLLNLLANAGCRLVGVEPRDELEASASLSELSAILSTSSKGGGIEAESAGRLQGALDFAERSIAEIATPLSSMATIRMGTTAVAAERIVATSGQHRLPIISPALGESRIVGYLHAKDLLDIPAEERTAPLPSSIHRPMAIIAADRSLVEALEALKLRRRHMALVIGDGVPVGVATVEQIIEGLLADPRPTVVA